MKQYILQSEWVNIDQDTRFKLIEKFRINKSGPVEVVNGRLVSDGASQADLRVMNLGALIEYLNKALPFFEEDLFDTLLHLTMGNLRSPVPEPIIEPVVPVEPEKVETPQKAISEATETIGTEVKKGCVECGSTSRHKKVCSLSKK